MKLRNIRKSRKGSAFIWLMAMLGIFFVAFVYIVNVKVYSEVFTAVNDSIDNSVVNFDPTVNKVNNAIRIWPLILIFGLILWAVFWSIRRSPESEFGP